jgi:hypothetical protein
VEGAITVVGCCEKMTPDMRLRIYRKVCDIPIAPPTVYIFDKDPKDPV